MKVRQRGTKNRENQTTRKTNKKDGNVWGLSKKRHRKNGWRKNRKTQKKGGKTKTNMDIKRKNETKTEGKKRKENIVIWPRIWRKRRRKIPTLSPTDIVENIKSLKNKHQAIYNKTPDKCLTPEVIHRNENSEFRHNGQKQW